MTISPSETPPRKDVHEELYRSLTDFFWKLADYAFKQGAITLLVYGWLLTAERAQHTFANSLLLCIVFTVLVVANLVVHLQLVYHSYHRSRQVYQQLLDLRYMPVDHYSSVVISKSFAISYSIAFAIGLVGVLVVFWTLPTLP